VDRHRRILVIEDDDSIRAAVVNILSHDGHQVTGAASGEEALRQYAGGVFDLVVLDLMLPGVSGLNVCDEIRKREPAQPILMLTAKSGEVDLLEGFRRGADDYVAKPFRMSELRARVLALLRRSAPTRRSATGFRFGRWWVRPPMLDAKLGDRVISLSDRELELVMLLAGQDGQIVSRSQILQELWGIADPNKIITRRVDMLVAKLRSKLHIAGETPIETVHGAGYRYESRRFPLSD